MFQNLRENQQIYVLTKNPNPSIDIANVVRIQGPVPKFQTAPNMIPQTEYVLDVTVNINGMTRTFQQLPVNKDSAEYVNDQTIVAMTRDAMNAELTALKNESLSAIQRGRDEEARLPIWDKLILQLNPEVAEKQRQEQEITSLKSQIATMASDNAELKSMMAKILERFEGENTQKSTTINKN